MVWNELRGQRPRPFAVRRGTGAAAATTLATRKVRVASVRRETADAVTFVLEATDGRPLVWLPGQFFTLLVRTEDGTTHRRAYSASAPPGDGVLPITVKRVDGGRVSTFLHERIAAGDTLEVLGPSGAFVVPEAPRPRTLVLVGGGSGITPLAAILRATLAEPDGATVHLVHASRRAEDAIFAASLAALAARHPGRCTVQPVLGDTFDARTLPTPAADDALYFVCGPRPMMDAVRATLLGRGVRPAQIREEHFASPGEAARATAAASPTAAATSAAPTAQPLLVRGPGAAAARSLLVAPGATLLEAGLAAAIPMPYSCAMGGCGACRVTLVSGTVASDEAFLTADERARGDVLACCSRPTSPCTIELPR